MLHPVESPARPFTFATYDFAPDDQQWEDERSRANQHLPVQLPWSTSNEDLVELFITIGKVDRAEIQYEPNGRSKGTGVVQFDSVENAETAIGMYPEPRSVWMN